jgi:hypothetical protein
MFNMNIRDNPSELFNFHEEEDIDTLRERHEMNLGREF